jgi:hypothetical protein
LWDFPQLLELPAFRDGFVPSRKLQATRKKTRRTSARPIDVGHVKQRPQFF